MSKTKFTKACTRYNAIESDRDLRKEKLSLVDYHVIGDGLRTLPITKKYLLISTCAANWFKRNGFTVSLDQHGVNYIVSM